MWLLTAMAALLFGQANAQSAAMVDPPSAVHATAPRDPVKSRFRVTNPGAAPIAVRLYLSDWAFDAVGDFTFSAPGTEPRGAGGWITFDPPSAVLAPGASVDVTYTVEVPVDALEGSHWSVVFVETEPPAPEPGQAATTFSVRVGHVVYVNVGASESSGAIRGIFAEPPRTTVEPLALLVQYANTGNVVQGVQGRLSLRDAAGIEVLEAPLERQVVLPGSDRVIRINLFGPLEAGNYTALVVLDFGDASLEVAGAIDVSLAMDLEAPEAP